MTLGIRCGTASSMKLLFLFTMWESRRKVLWDPKCDGREWWGVTGGLKLRQAVPSLSIHAVAATVERALGLCAHEQAYPFL